MKLSKMRLSVSFYKRHKKDNNIIDGIINAYISDSIIKDRKEYQKKCYKLLCNKNIKTLNSFYKETQLISHQIVKDVDYFLIDEGENTSLNEVSLAVLVISDYTEESRAIVLVKENIEKILKSFNTEIINNEVLLYHVEKNGEFDPTHTVKAEINKPKYFTVQNRVRYYITLFLLGVSIFIILKFQNKDSWISTFFSIGLTLLWAFISDYFSMKLASKKLVINDFNTLIVEDSRLNQAKEALMVEDLPFGNPDTPLIKEA